MTNLSRLLLALLAGGTALGAAAQSPYPAKPIRFIVPFPAGSQTDIVTRIVIQPLARSLGQPMVVDNRAGADGAIAGELVAKSAADGYTMFTATNSPLSAVPFLRKKPPYDAVKDFTPISLLGFYTFFVFVHPSVPAKSLADLVQYGKTHPGKLNYATGNTTSIVSTAQFMTLAGMKMTHVPYKGEPGALTDLVGNQVQVMLGATSAAFGHVREGRLRALAVLLDRRSPLMPDVPTMAEAGQPKFSIGPWAGVFGPAGMPRPVVQRLSDEINAALKLAEVRDQLDKQAFVHRGSTPEALGQFVKDQLAVWGKTMRESGIQPE